MSRLSSLGRCSYCFQMLEEPSLVCRTCEASCDRLLRFAGVFSYDSQAASLVKELKYGARQELAPLLASWMVVQLEELKFPWPDAIIAVPPSPLRRFIRGYNPSALLASSIAKIMKVPLLRPLQRRWAATAQAGKTLEQRCDMPKDEFRLRSCANLAKKNILLIDDVITTGTTVKRCARALQPAFPESIHALAFCLA